jgi:hypothetical protein
MALAAHSRRTVFGRVKSLVAAATGAKYSDRLEIGSTPQGRDSHFVIGKRRTRALRGEMQGRAQAGEAVTHTYTYPIEFAKRVKGADREERRLEIDDVLDSLQRAAMGQTTADTAGIEFFWVGEDEVQASSGEWWIIRGILEAKCKFALSAP